MQRHFAREQLVHERPYPAGMPPTEAASGGGGAGAIVSPKPKTEERRERGEESRRERRFYGTRKTARRDETRSTLNWRVVMGSIDGDAQPGLGDSLFRRGLGGADSARKAMEGAGNGRQLKGVGRQVRDKRALIQHSWVELAGVAAMPDIPNSERWSSNADAATKTVNFARGHACLLFQLFAVQLMRHHCVQTVLLSGSVRLCSVALVNPGWGCGWREAGRGQGT